MKRVVLISMSCVFALIVLNGCHISDLDMKVKDVNVDPFYGSVPLVSQDTNGLINAQTALETNVSHVEKH